MTLFSLQRDVGRVNMLICAKLLEFVEEGHYRYLSHYCKLLVKIQLSHP